jgi:hypothetical protein
MRARDIVGKQVARVEQARVQGNARMVTSIVSIVFTDGTRIYPIVYELQDDYCVDFGVVKPAKNQEKK